jgi:hypothetical protein
MSVIKLQGNAAGTGTLTIAAPNTNNTQTLTLPDATGTVALLSNGLGYSQTWQTFTSGQRSPGTTYTNSTGLPITVQATITSTLAGDYPIITIQGIILYSSVMGAAGTIGAVFGIVPPGNTYVVNTNNASATFHSWRELR